MERLDVSAGELRGVWCPACGTVCGIHRERRTRELGAGDVLAAAAFGWVAGAMVLFGRSTVRLRCSACRCRFPEPLGVARAMGVPLASAALLGGVMYLGLRDVWGLAVAMIAVAFVVLLHAAVCVWALQRVRDRWRVWRWKRASADSDRRDSAGAVAAG